MPDPACLYALLEAPRERHEELILRVVQPLARRWREEPRLDSLFFVRFSEPTWQLRFRVLGDDAWIAGEARTALDQALRAPLEDGLVAHARFARYERELDRYGGPAGMRIAERLFHLDSMAALDRLELEQSGGARWTRREFVLALVERYADGFGFAPTVREEFDRQGYQWAFDSGVWDADQRRTLDQAYARNEQGLRALLEGPQAGGASSPDRALVEEFASAAAPWFEELRDGLASGGVTAHAPYLAWSLTHMFTNRMGVEPAGEAILRYMAWRLHGGGPQDDGR
ncbi:MAG: thiopeptide-type bacteriocin biosynthesis protein [Candidatus Eisenbacteria bacterium]